MTFQQKILQAVLTPTEEQEQEILEEGGEKRQDTRCSIIAAAEGH